MSYSDANRPIEIEKRERASLIRVVEMESAWQNNNSSTKVSTSFHRDELQILYFAVIELNNPTITRSISVYFSMVNSSDNNVTFVATFIYASNFYQRRKELFHRLQFITSTMDLPWLVLGDFNRIGFPSEKEGISDGLKHIKLLMTVANLNKYKPFP